MTKNEVVKKKFWIKIHLCIGVGGVRVYYLANHYQIRAAGSKATNEAGDLWNRPRNRDRRESHLVFHDTRLWVLRCTEGGVLCGWCYWFEKRLDGIPVIARIGLANLGFHSLPLSPPSRSTWLNPLVPWGFIDVETQRQYLLVREYELPSAQQYMYVLTDAGTTHMKC